MHVHQCTNQCHDALRSRAGVSGARHLLTHPLDLPGFRVPHQCETHQTLRPIPNSYTLHTPSSRFPTPTESVDSRTAPPVLVLPGSTINHQPSIANCQPSTVECFCSNCPPLRNVIAIKLARSPHPVHHWCNEHNDTDTRSRQSALAARSTHAAACPAAAHAVIIYQAPVPGWGTACFWLAVRHRTADTGAVHGRGHHAWGQRQSCAHAHRHHGALLVNMGLK